MTRPAEHALITQMLEALKLTTNDLACAIESEGKEPSLDRRIVSARAAIKAAEQAQPAELTDEEIDEVVAHCHDGIAYPQDALLMPKLMRRREARAVLAAQGAKA